MDTRELDNYVKTLEARKLLTPKQLGELGREVAFRKWADNLIATAEAIREPALNGRKLLRAPSPGG